MLRSVGRAMIRRRLRGSGMNRIAGTGRILPFRRGLLGLGIPVVAALLNDLRDPDGYLRQFYYRIRGREQGIRVIEAGCEQIDDGRKEVAKPDDPKKIDKARQ
ncbi:MAG TPA: hypothetical protein PLM29_08170 [Deltaproteobacteria bacterium]|nr:hypothetical protein [Deltaproteobacteria bacterium]